ncbi:hypothetical protein NE602_22490, partial [Bacteroides cellulosilyticus]
TKVGRKRRERNTHKAECLQSTSNNSYSKTNEYYIHILPYRTRFYPFHPLRPMNRGMQDSRSFEKFIAIAGKLKVTY